MDWKTALINLLKVKSLVTILTTLVFCYLLIMGIAISQEFMMIYTVIIAFYFGTQTQKIKNGVNNEDSERVPESDTRTDT